MESEVVKISNSVEILYDNYQTGSGPPPIIEYKNGSTEENCNNDSWNIYSDPFIALGYIKIKVRQIGT
jgi:hypothetical protein